jgi:Stigma-specific protein, Stig1
MKRGRDPPQQGATPGAPTDATKIDRPLVVGMRLGGSLVLLDAALGGCGQLAAARADDGATADGATDVPQLTDAVPIDAFLDASPGWPAEATVDLSDATEGTGADASAHADADARADHAPEDSMGLDACADAETRCHGACVDLEFDMNNCGACDQSCPNPARCSRGRCEGHCAGTQCGITCVDLTSDPANCGTCGKGCSGGQSCIAGQCKGSTSD